MLRRLIVAAVLAAASAPAFAADIAVALANKGKNQTQAEISRTAFGICGDESYRTLESIVFCGGGRARLASKDWAPLDIR